jgi:hypothetical protein
MPTLLDTHVHLYPHFSIDGAISSSRRGLSRDSQMVWFLVDREGQSNFKTLRDTPATLGCHAHTPSSVASNALALSGDDGQVLVIDAQQVVSHERLEILCVPRIAESVERLPAEQIIARAIACESVPILPWSPGKWLFGRGKVMRQLLARFGPSLVLGDIPMRPDLPVCGTSFERILAYGSAMHDGQTLSVLAGSDPLPLRGEDTTIGRFTTESAERFDPHSIGPSVRDILRQPHTLKGDRNSIAKAASRWLRLQRNK